MGTRHITLAALLAAIAIAWLAAGAAAFELGDVQAVPGGHPPYVFRLPLVRNSGDGSDVPSVTVRRPTDALGVVKNQTLELRLPNLTDVELEISYGGQTLNRLFLTRELQTADARLTATLAWNRYQAAKAKGQAHSQLAALVDQAYQTHRVWAQFDPRRAQPLFSRVERERRHVLAADRGGQPPRLQDIALADPTPPPPASQEAADPALLEEEMRRIRAEIHGLVGEVLPWTRAFARPWQDEAPAITPMVAALLGGMFAAGIALLGTGYVMQRRALKRERQRRRLVAAALRHGHAALPAAARALSLAYPADAAGHRNGAAEPLATRRRMRVSHRTRWRLQRRGAKGLADAAHAPPLEQTRRLARLAQPGGAGHADLLEALGNLRRELLCLQGLLPCSTNASAPPSGPGPAAR
jgi:hypothetical protein